MPKIVAAAIKRPDGTVWTGGRHWKIMFEIEEQTGETPGSLGQGFVTDEGVFVDRYEAYEIAVASGQIQPMVTRRYCMSEDLW